MSDYDKLKAIWDKKLKKSGFKDAETNDGRLIRWGTDFTRQKSINSQDAKEAYYRYCRYFLNDYHFETPRQRIIWEYHTEGLSVRDIVKLLKKVRVKTNRQSVWLIVSDLEKIMKKMYLAGLE